MSASHSFWKSASMPGTEVAEMGLGLIDVSFGGASCMRLSGCSCCCVMGQVLSEALSAASIAERSKRCPDLVETTGVVGVVPVSAQSMV